MATVPCLEPVEQFFMFNGMPCKSRRYANGCRWRVRLGDTITFFRTKAPAEELYNKLKEGTR